MSGMVQFLFIFLAIFSVSPVVATAEENSWSDLLNELNQHPQVIYSDPEIPYNSGGFIVTNEFGHQTFSISNDVPGDILVGFGTTVNLSIARARKVRTLIFADISQDVALAHIGLFRPLFLMSNSPEEFLGRAASVQFEDGATLDEVARRVEEMQFSTDVLESTRNKLNQLVTTGKISEKAAAFCVEALLAQNPRSIVHTTFGRILGIESSPFRDVLLGNRFPIHLIEYHHKSTIDRLANDERITLPQNFEDSFENFNILSPEGFNFLRDLYINNQVFVAHADMFDLKLWTTIRKFAYQRNQTVSDIYTSNIAHLH